MKLKFKLPKFSKMPRFSDIRLPLDLKNIESMDRDHYRMTVYGLGAVIVLMIVAGLGAFALSLRGAEQTMVPDVQGVELSQALLKLQEKELYPRVLLRFTDNPQDRGRIVDQKPKAGTIVKAGRRIELSVSRGAVADRVENFMGQDIEEVKIHLRTLFATARPLLSVKEPPVYIFDSSPAGTILEQKPLPETELSGQTLLELVVSKGPEKAQVRVPELAGLSIKQALDLVGSNNLPVKFSMRKADSRERPGTVVAQLPTAGSMIPASGRVSLTVAAPTPDKGMLSGVYSRELPSYPYPLKISLDVIKPSGDRETLVTLNHPGGLFTAPYFLPEGSVLVLSVLDREVPPRTELRTP